MNVQNVSVWHSSISTCLWLEGKKRYKNFVIHTYNWSSLPLKKCSKELTSFLLASLLPFPLTNNPDKLSETNVKNVSSRDMCVNIASRTRLNIDGGTLLTMNKNNNNTSKNNKSYWNFEKFSHLWHLHQGNQLSYLCLHPYLLRYWEGWFLWISFYFLSLMSSFLYESRLRNQD